MTSSMGPGVHMPTSSTCASKQIMRPTKRKYFNEIQPHPTDTNNNYTECLQSRCVLCAQSGDKMTFTENNKLDILGTRTH